MKVGDKIINGGVLILSLNVFTNFQPQSGRASKMVKTLWLGINNNSLTKEREKLGNPIHNVFTNFQPPPSGRASKMVKTLWIGINNNSFTKEREKLGNAIHNVFTNFEPPPK